MTIRTRYDVLKSRMARKKLVPSFPSERLFEQRGLALYKDGFLSWERAWLVQHQISSAGMKSMRNSRRKLMVESKGEGWTRQSYFDFVRDIVLMYRRNGWVFKNGRLNPFAMLEFYKRMADIPDTPQPKRRRIRKEPYKGRAKKTREKQKSIPDHDEYIKRHRLA